MRNFRNFIVYTNSIEFVKSIYTITANWPLHERFGLTSQITRAAVSIPSNIAEGSSRRSEKDFSRFLGIALGSAFEVETQLVISKEINYLAEHDFNKLSTELTIIQKQLNSLISKLRK